MYKNEVYSKRLLNPERLKAINEFGGSTILDVGCGNGKYVLDLSEKGVDIKGIDYQEFDSWRQNPSLFTVADIMNLPFGDNSFDTVTLFEVLEHIKEPVKALKECYRVCSQNLIITVPNCDITPGMRNSLVTYYHYTDETHVNFFVMDSLAKVIKESGFNISSIKLVNSMSFEPLIQEAYDLNPLVSKGLIKILKLFGSKKYFLTLMVNATKI